MTYREVNHRHQKFSLVQILMLCWGSVHNLAPLMNTKAHRYVNSRVYFYYISWIAYYLCPATGCTCLFTVYSVMLILIAFRKGKIYYLAAGPL